MLAHPPRHRAIAPLRELTGVDGMQDQMSQVAAGHAAAEDFDSDYCTELLTFHFDTPKYRTVLLV